jgi:ABC-2 type transport system permease protein
MSAIYVLWQREVIRHWRSRAALLTALGQPVLYVFILGFGLDPVFQRAGEGDYVEFIAPGIIGMGILTVAVFSGMSLLWDRQFGFLRETLVAPVPRLQIMIGRTLGGATTALLQGVLVLAVCFIAGFRPHSVQALPIALLFMVLISVVFAALGTAIGAALRDQQGFQMVMSFLVMPVFLLSGAIFPLTGLPTALAIATRLDPLAYGIDGLRGALSGGSHMGLPLDLAALVGVAAVLLVLGARSFARIEA